MNWSVTGPEQRKTNLLDQVIPRRLEPRIVVQITQKERVVAYAAGCVAWTRSGTS